MSLPLKSCAHVDNKLVQAEHDEMQAIATWATWVSSHLSPHVLQHNSACVLAAVVLHAAWRLKLGEGLPLLKTLDRVLALVLMADVIVG